MWKDQQQQNRAVDPRVTPIGQTPGPHYPWPWPTPPMPNPPPNPGSPPPAPPPAPPAPPAPPPPAPPAPPPAPPAPPAAPPASPPPAAPPVPAGPSDAQRLADALGVPLSQANILIKKKTYKDYLKNLEAGTVQAVTGPGAPQPPGAAPGPQPPGNGLLDAIKGALGSFAGAQPQGAPAPRRIGGDAGGLAGGIGRLLGDTGGKPENLDPGFYRGEGMPRFPGSSQGGLRNTSGTPTPYSPPTGANIQEILAGILGIPLNINKYPSKLGG